MSARETGNIGIQKPKYLIQHLLYIHLRQPLQNHSSGHLRVGDAAVGRGMLDEQHQRVDIPAHARTAHKGFPQKRLEKGSLLHCPSCPPDDPVGQGTKLNWTDTHTLF